MVLKKLFNTDTFFKYVGANCTEEDPRYGSKYIYK